MTTSLTWKQSMRLLRYRQPMTTSMRKASLPVTGTMANVFSLPLWVVLNEDGKEIESDRSTLKDLAELYCPKCGSSVLRQGGPHGTVFVEAGEYDEARQEYAEEGDYDVYRCHCGFQFADVTGLPSKEDASRCQQLRR